jgi:hypothetical protein
MKRHFEFVNGFSLEFLQDTLFPPSALFNNFFAARKKRPTTKCRAFWFHSSRLAQARVYRFENFRAGT